MIYATQTLESVLEQYEKQKEILERAEILVSFANGDQGIVGIDGRAYPLPSREDIQNRANGNREVLETKVLQGFSRLIMTPFGMSLDQFHEKVSGVILKHSEEAKLFATKKDLNDPNEKLIPVDLDANQPFWRWDKYKDANKNGTLVYDPIEFSEKHQGKTKLQILADTTGGGSSGWRVSLVEDIPNLPFEKAGKTIGGRRQIEANKSPIDYLASFQSDRNYVNEHGMTPEDWAMYFLSHLEETDQIIDDYEGAGNVSWNLGGYFPENSGVPTACFVRSVRQVRAGWLGARYFGPVYCARSLVRII
ncbi:MAG: hypothetical protein WCT49_00445 [Candidatus Paceibacterota bacterium]|jgi:hypothetical protein|nr:hypothetical protein [Candidatus Paceibacterota bacterium]